MIRFKGKVSRMILVKEFMMNITKNKLVSKIKATKFLFVI